LASFWEDQLIPEENGLQLRKSYTGQHFATHKRGSWKGNCSSAHSIWHSKTPNVPC